MRLFHISIHARPPGTASGGPFSCDGQVLQCLDVEPARLAAEPFQCTFEAAIEALSRLERLYGEPDGSFVWVSGSSESPWQIDGNMFDRAGRIQFVELKGWCPPIAFAHLLACFGWPQQQLIAQLVRPAVFIEMDEFRQMIDPVARPPV